MRKTYWLLLGIIIIATFLRTYHLAELPPGLYPDEATNGTNALEAIRTTDFSAAGGWSFGAKVFYPENNGREGLFMNIQALFLAATDLREPWVLRLPSALFGILTVLGLFFLTRELFRRSGEGGNSGPGMPQAEKIALLAAFLLATSFWHINFSRIGFRAITAPFYLVWALYFFFFSLRVSRPPRSSFLAVCSGFFFGLGFHSYLSYRVMPLLLLLFIPFSRKESGFWKVTGVFIAAACIVAAPLGWYYLEHPADFMGRTSQVSVFSSPTPFRDLAGNILKTTAMFNLEGDGNWRHNVAGRPELFLPVGILFVAGIGLALARIARGAKAEKFAPLLLLFWIALAALPVVISNEGIPHALRAILMIPPVMILAAWAGIWLSTMQPLRGYVRRASGTLLLAILAFEAWHTYFIIWGKDPATPGAFTADYVTLAREIRALPDAVPKYIVVEAGGTPITIDDAWTGTKREVAVPAQTVMFMTDSYAVPRQKEKNIHWLSPAERSTIPEDAAVFTIR